MAWETTWESAGYQERQDGSEPVTKGDSMPNISLADQITYLYMYVCFGLRLVLIHGKDG